MQFFAYADTEEPMICVASGNALPGNTLSVSIEFRNNPGVAAVNLDVTFDQSLLTLKSVTYGDSYKDGGESISSKQSPVRLSWSALKEVARDTTFATLLFSVSETASPGNFIDISVSYTKGNICNMQEDDVSFSCKGTKILIEDTSSPMPSASPVPSASPAPSTSPTPSASPVTPTSPVNPSPIPSSPYDVNSDGNVSSADLICLAKRLSDCDTQASQTNFDFNEDGITDLLDLVFLMKYLAKI